MHRSGLLTDASCKLCTGLSESSLSCRLQYMYLMTKNDSDKTHLVLPRDATKASLENMIQPYTIRR